jgi:hypothetical protein
MGCFSAGKNANVFPCKSRIHSHVMYLPTYPTVPAGLGQLYKVSVTFVDLFEFCFYYLSLLRCNEVLVMQFM